jgi:hypothetical protein
LWHFSQGLMRQWHKAQNIHRVLQSSLRFIIIRFIIINATAALSTTAAVQAFKRWHIQLARLLLLLLGHGGAGLGLLSGGVGLATSPMHTAA